MDAGKLNKRLGVLALRETAEGWEWEETGKVWARVELTGKSNLFSRVGIGARDALITIRKRALSLHQALRWEGRHLFLTEITEPEKGWMEVHAALVEPVECIANVHEGSGGPRFPGVLTERYVRHEQGEPMETNAICYVLVVPKPITFRLGGLIRVGETVFKVLALHPLDPLKNEYEIMRIDDL